MGKTGFNSNEESGLGEVPSGGAYALQQICSICFADILRQSMDHLLPIQTILDFSLCLNGDHTNL